MKLNWSIWSCVLGLFATMFVSCGTEKRLRQEQRYLQVGTLDTVTNRTIKYSEASIQKGDQLAITVYSDDPEATAIYNQAQASAGGVSAPGYLVDQEGNIRFQGLGVVHVEGLSKLQLMRQMDETLKTYLTNPYTDIRFLNFRVNVIGEVAKPGVVTTPEGRLTILEVIGMAGELTPFGRRDNVLVIRESKGEREFGRINLRRSDVFQSPYFFLQQNDVVLVEANKRKPSGNDLGFQRNLSLAATVLGLLSTVLVLVTYFQNK